jgi:DNA-binding beta-propeller fold protein YncE
MQLSAEREKLSLIVDTVRRAGGAGIVAVLVSVVPASPAWAARGHFFEGSFGAPCSASPCPGGQLSEPSGLAVNEATGDIYVLDQGNDRVERFSASGEFKGQFDGSGEFEVEGVKSSDTVAGAGGLPSEKESGKFSFASGEANSQPSALAIDNSCALQKLIEPECAAKDPSNEDVYVLDTGHEVIDKFTPTGKYVGQITEAQNAAGESGPFNVLLGVGVDKSGVVLGYQKGGTIEGGEVDSFSDALLNAFAGRVEFATPASRGFLSPGLAIDGDQNFYVRGEREGSFRVEKFNHEGQLVIAELDK